MVTLEWAIITNIDVVSLLLGELGQVCTKGWKVQLGNLLIKCLWEEVHIILVGLGGDVVRVEIQLGKSLVGERA